MKPRRLHSVRLSWEYVTKRGVCLKCHLRKFCTRSRTGRTMRRHRDQKLLDRARRQANTKQAKLDRKRRQHLLHEPRLTQGQLFHQGLRLFERPGFCYRGRSKPNAFSKRSTAFSSRLVLAIACRSLLAFSRYSGFRSTSSISKVNRGTVSSFNGTNAPVFV